MNDLLPEFNAANVRYLLIGGQAMRLAGMPRYSMDRDFVNSPGKAAPGITDNRRSILLRPTSSWHPGLIRG
jgi:hypothetical protein